MYTLIPGRILRAPKLGLLNRHWTSPPVWNWARLLSTVERQTSPVLVFEAPSCRAVRILKVFSVGTAVTSLSTVPLTWMCLGSSLIPATPLAVFVVGFTALSSVSITAFLSFILKPYISRIFVQPPVTRSKSVASRLPKLSLLTPLERTLKPTGSHNASTAPVDEISALKGGSILTSVFGSHSQGSKAATTDDPETIQTRYRERMAQALDAFPIPLDAHTLITLETVSMLGRFHYTTLPIEDLTPSTRFMKTWQVKSTVWNRQDPNQRQSLGSRYFWLEWKADVTRYARINEAVVWRIGQLIHQNREDDKQIRHRIV
ncbi:hypothetical protein IWQ62_000044 [Dispira parvispora]|uniref:Uncharacterized protein n=1 Tax=Dispira parvispora TaxID=1520584 RepID=A0A9W8B1F2_9FUNG|nr:hypothetical protein IWQ62_000044 [Dispira parvispora]